MLDAPHVGGLVMHRTREDDFLGEYRTLFTACRTLFQAGKPIDPVTVVDKAGRQYAQLVRDLMDETPTAANVEIYLDLVVEQAKLLRIQGLPPAW